MAFISIAGEFHIFNPIIKRKENAMKEYEVILKQEVEGTLLIKADTKAEAKVLIQELINDSKMQHLIQDVDNDLDCESWEIKSVEDY